MSILLTLGGIGVCAALVAWWCVLGGRAGGIEAPPDLPDVRYPEQLRAELWPDSAPDTPHDLSNGRAKNHGAGSRRDIPYGG